jgi:hypothetical protein
MTALHAVTTSQGTSGPGPLPAIIGLAVIVLLVATRTRGTPLRAAKLIILPAVVLVIGALAAAATAASTKPHLHPLDAVIIVVDVALSLTLGIARGVSVRIYRQDGSVWYRYGGATVALWALSIGLRFALGAFGAHHGASPLTTSASVLFMLGLSLLAQNTVMLRRSARQPVPRPGRQASTTQSGETARLRWVAGPVSAESRGGRTQHSARISSAGSAAASP